MADAVYIEGLWASGQGAVTIHPNATYSNRATKTSDGSRLSWVSYGAPDFRMLQEPSKPNPSNYGDFVVLRDR